MTGINIIQNQSVEFRVESKYKHLDVDVNVMSPFEDVFHIQPQSIQESIYSASLIPAFPGKYVLHLTLKLSGLILHKLDIIVTVE